MKVITKENKRYVWVNLKTGKFSNSWTEKVHNELMDKEILKISTTGENENTKLIEYKCINDDNFEFSKFMKLK